VNELTKRVLVACLLVPGFLFFLYIGKLFLILFILGALSLAYWEFLKIYEKKEELPPPSLSLLLLWLFTLLPMLRTRYFSIFFLISPFLFYALYPILRGRGTSIRGVAYSIFGILILGVSGVLVYRTREIGFLYVLYFFLLVWSFDTGSYFFGKFVGRKKFPGHLSPSKTWEGVGGGIISALLLALIFSNLDIKLLKSSLHFYLSAILVSAFSLLGDLAESAIKREKGIKDSSNLLPGHGGVLDRIDSVVLSIPFYYLFLVTFVKGGLR